MTHCTHCECDQSSNQISDIEDREYLESDEIQEMLTDGVHQAIHTLTSLAAGPDASLALKAADALIKYLGYKVV